MIKPAILITNTMVKYTFIEVCAGAGGLSSGLMKAGFHPFLLNDINKDCCETLRMNHPGANIQCCEMQDLKLDKYIDAVDLLTGGVPCQSFSQAGKRLGLDDPRGDLIVKFVDLVDTLRPKMFMIENVKGLLTHNSGETLQHVLELIGEDTYDVAYKVLNATKYGVPQKRERLFIVGVRKQQVEFTFPNESTARLMCKDVLVDVPHSEGATYSEYKKALFDMIPQGGCWVNLPVAIQKEYLGASYNSGGGKRGILRRLSMDAPCLTLLCSPSQKQTERCHPLETRPLTTREYARIQTFPDDYDFYGSMSSVYKQIGNAVPVELARRMGVALKKCLAEMAKN